MPVWGVVNQKGGVGKTTTAVNLAAGLAASGFKTLLIDADPQGNATTGVGFDKQRPEVTLYEVLVASADDENSTLVYQAIYPVAEGFFILPATLDLAGIEPTLLSAVGKERILAEAIRPIQDDYDWIIIDSPPSLGLLTINILAASDAVLVPMQCEFYALEGLSQLMKTIELVRRRINPSLHVAKVLLTMVDSRNRLTQQVAEEVRKFFGSKVCETVIPRNVRLSEAPGFGEPAISLYPGSKGALAYQEFVKEVQQTCAVR